MSLQRRRHRSSGPHRSSTRRWIPSIPRRSNRATWWESASTRRTCCVAIKSGASRVNVARSWCSEASTSLYPEEAREHGAAHAIVTGDGDLIWSKVLEDVAAGRLAPRYDGGRVEGDAFLSARWDLLPSDRYMWGSVQTVRGCPKHCSFCSVWRTDGQKPRQRGVSGVVREIVELRRQGFRFILLADDNFYPVTLQDLEQAKRRAEIPAVRHALVRCAANGSS